MMRQPTPWLFSVLLILAGLLPIACAPAQPAGPPGAGPVVTTAAPPPPSPTPSPTPTPSPAPTPTLPPEQAAGLRSFPSPDGRWTAVIDDAAGRLELRPTADGGAPVPVPFPEARTLDVVEWSPDSRQLLVVRPGWRRAPSGYDLEFEGALEIWLVRLPGPAGGPIEAPRRLFQSSEPPPEQVVFGPWSPDGRRRLFWQGILSASILADGLGLWALDTETGRSTPLAEAALLNPRYQSWAPDGSALAFTAGGYRSAQINKWLNLYDVASGQVTTVVSQTEQVPGVVAWSPRGDLIAYAAVPAGETGNEWADLMTFDLNPAIAGRRVYLLDPASGRHWRLNQADAFQDAPVWSDDGAVLYYVQRAGDFMALLAADPETGQAQVVEGTRRPAPRAVGYYGQSEWDDLLARRPAAPQAELPPLSDTYTAPVHGFRLRYPAGWTVADGWQGVFGWRSMPTLQSFPAAGPEPDLGPFGGQAVIAVQTVDAPDGGLKALLEATLASPGPGQILERGGSLLPFDRQGVTVDGRPAIRLETMGQFGVVNHVLIVLDGERGYILRGRGDGRLFEAVAGSLQLPKR